ncbi:MAG: hypothetical protein QHH07_07485 [Sedimentisphaerales bacterium]|nr:hypothetical protein [Sedimentisphaerales bacterium]
MRRTGICMLIVMLAAVCTSAAVRIIVEGQDGMVAIKYQTDGERVRAFGLDVKLSAGTFTGVSDFIRGESTAARPGYGIFPAKFAQFITVDPQTGEVTDWNINDYNPIADPCDPGALGGLGTNGVTLEMGALYYPPTDNSPNAPPTSGLLCKLAISQSAKVTVTENVVRGGIVLTDPTKKPVVDLSLATDIQVNK